jgi:toxin FitB
VSFLLDTNVVSEWVKPSPNPGLVAWAKDVDEEELFLSVVSLAELRYGAERLASGQRRAQLERWLEHELLLRFENRILFVNIDVADLWGRITARCASSGKPISTIDGFLAATAEVHSLTLVTRNVQHFSVLKTVLNPWA